MKALSSAVLFISALISGCQSVPSSTGTANPDAITAQKNNTTFSGFPGDHSQLELASDREGLLIFIDRSADYRPYTKVIFDPVDAYVTPNPEIKNVLCVRAAITGIQPVKPPAEGTDYVPIKAVVNLGSEAVDAAPRIVGMSAEMKVLDARGKRVAAPGRPRKCGNGRPRSRRCCALRLSATVSC